MPIARNGRKQCTRCRKTKAVTSYTRLSGTSDGFREHCKQCAKQYNAAYFANLSEEEKQRRYQRDKEWKAANVERMRISWHRAKLKKYGMTQQDYEQLLLAQNGVCAICRREERGKVNGRTLPLSIDHDHTTGRVRGLLCGKCNTSLGGFEDNQTFIMSALTYLQRHDADNTMEGNDV
jgi:hypothetical protein